MRDRLIELMRNAPKTDTVYGNIKLAEPVQTLQTIADHLLANGVIVPPVKVGQTVYVPWKWNGEKGIATIEIEEIRIYDSKNPYMFFIDMESDDEDYNQTYGEWKIGDEIGKTIFLTREEAEAALAERGEG